MSDTGSDTVSVPTMTDLLKVATAEVRSFYATARPS
jgi:hypothetical protein